jgi:beta-galactosidase/beta-glucuronidase
MPVLADKNASGTQCGSNLGTSYPTDGGAVKTHATNVVSVFKDSPSVAMWEVLNEGEYAASTKPFYAAVVAEIRRIDPYAVVGYGAKTCYYAVGTATWNQCKDTMGQPSNDFIDFHEYDAGTGVSHWTDDHQRIAADTGKPWIMGEFGFCCNGAPSGFTSFDAANGSGYVKAEWESYLNAGASSVLYWSAVLAPSTAADQLNPSKAAWAGIRTYTHQWQGN